MRELAMLLYFVSSGFTCCACVVYPDQNKVWLPSDIPEYSCTDYGEQPSLQRCPKWTIVSGMDDVDVILKVPLYGKESCTTYMKFKPKSSNFERQRLQVNLLCSSECQDVEPVQAIIRKAGNDEMCELDSDCWSLDQECGADKKCTCTNEHFNGYTNYIFYPEGNACISEKYPGEACVSRDQCRAYSHCNAGYCQCDEGYYYNNSWCLKRSQRPGEPCLTQEDCDPSAQCQSGHCMCPHGMQPNSNGSTCYYSEITSGFRYSLPSWPLQSLLAVLLAAQKAFMSA